MADALQFAAAKASAHSDIFHARRTAMTNTETDRLANMISTFKDDIKEEFRHQLGIQSEAFQHKLDLVVEGHQMLAEKIDRVKMELEDKIGCVKKKLDAVAAQADRSDAKLNTVTEKLDAVAADLSAHRADTEVHKKVYKVKED